MNYIKAYCNLIRKAESRSKLFGYAEKHHVFPISLFGKNKRTVKLTAREHYVAHALLEKVCIKRYGLHHYKTKKMICAHLMMKGKSKNRCHANYYNSRLYECARKRLSLVKTGVPRSQECRDKISRSRTGKKYSPLTEKHRQNIRLGKLGKPISSESKEKIRQTRQKLGLNRIYLIIDPDGNQFISNNLNHFCKIHGLVTRNMATILNKNSKTKTHRGWTVRYCDKDPGLEIPPEGFFPLPISEAPRLK